MSHIRSIEFIGYQETLSEPMALFNVISEDGGGTTLAEQTLRERGINIPPHPDYTTWLANRMPHGVTMSIEQALQRLNARLEHIDRLLTQKKARMAELAPLIRETSELKSTIGRLKRDRKAIVSKRDWLVGFFREMNGAYPDGMYPLFGQEQNAQAH